MIGDTQTHPDAPGFFVVYADGHDSYAAVQRFAIMYANAQPPEAQRAEESNFVERDGVSAQAEAEDQTPAHLLIRERSSSLRRHWYCDNNAGGAVYALQGADSTGERVVAWPA